MLERWRGAEVRMWGFETLRIMIKANSYAGLVYHFLSLFVGSFPTEIGWKRSIYIR
jgi:hypothetical protein